MTELLLQKRKVILFLEEGREWNENLSWKQKPEHQGRHMSAVEICSRTNKALKSRDAHMRDQIYSWKSQFDDITNWKVKSQNAKLDDFIISRYYIAAADEQLLCWGKRTRIRKHHAAQPVR